MSLQTKEGPFFKSNEDYVLQPINLIRSCSAISRVSMQHALKPSRTLFGRDRWKQSRLDLGQGLQVGLVGPLGGQPVNSEGFVRGHL